MAANNPEPYLDPVSAGVCEVLNCSSPASFRASWVQGVIVRLVCTTHKAEIEGRLFGDLTPSKFAKKRVAKKKIAIPLAVKKPGLNGGGCRVAQPMPGTPENHSCRITHLK